MKRTTLVTLAVLLASALPASGRLQGTGAFPRLRLGFGDQPNAGGGVIGGDTYVTRNAVIAWNRHWHTLTLYLLWRRSVTCRTLRAVTTKPGHLIQVWVTDKPHVTVGAPMAGPQVAFLTVYRNANRPTHVAGLKSGAQLMFTRVDSYPKGVWHGIFKVPRNVYGDGKVYGYNGTFAAKWCELNR